MAAPLSHTCLDRALGSYLGLAVGDALGATVEFMTASEIKSRFRVHHEIVGGGWLSLKPGQVTDDTQMCLAMGQAIIERDGWDLEAVADSFLKWMLSMPADIGSTCRQGIRRYMMDGSLSTSPSPDNGGNGGAMRNLPAVLTSLGDTRSLEERTLQQARITHHHPLADAGTVALARMTRQLILGSSIQICRNIADGLAERHPEFRYDPWPGRTSGYIVDTIQTVFDALFNTDSFNTALICAVNRGGDADTIGALTGQLAGAYYGVRSIPARWLKRIDPAINRRIHEQTSALLEIGARLAH